MKTYALLFAACWLSSTCNAAIFVVDSTSDSNLLACTAAIMSAGICICNNAEVKPHRLLS
jgi:hypothetical protein